MTPELALSSPLEVRDAATAPRVACSHCGQTVPQPSMVSGQAQAFCCSGCEAAYGAILACGLAGYYAVRDASAAEAQPVAAGHRDFNGMDDEAFATRYVRTLPSGLWQTELYLERVHCAACVWIVERLGQVQPGVVSARLDLTRSTVELVWDPQRTRLSQVARWLDRFGYPPHPFRGAQRQRLHRQEERDLLLRLGLAWAVSGNVMVMSMSLWAGWFDDMDLQTAQLFRWASMIIALPSVLWSARPFFSGAWSSLRHGALHMDLPIAMGLAAGYIGGAVNVLRGHGEIYFDSVASLIFLLLVGRWLQHRQRRQAQEAAELLYALTPMRARRLAADGTAEDVALEHLQPGDVVEVRADEAIPVDGVIVGGQSCIDAAILTGESRPVTVGPGCAVHAGTQNVSSLLQVRVAASGEETRVAKLMQAVQEAARRRAPIVAMADAIVGRFVAVVLAVAALTALVWCWIDPTVALDHTVALLIVTCPCALGLATPLAIHAAVGRASRAGLFVKGGDVIERLSQPRRVWFDKTGTLTQGRTALTHVALDAALQPWVLAVERHSGHPLAKAVVSAWQQIHPLLDAQDVTAVVGGGVAAQVAGHHVQVGAPRWLAGCADPDDYQACAARWARDGVTPVLVAVDDMVVGALGFGDPLRPDAAAAIAALRQRGCEVGIVSGDHPAVVAAVGRALGLPTTACHGGVTPEGKLALVERAMREGGVVMVGDGVNDAAALAAATVGVSVHGGAEASLQACDAFLTRPGVAAIVDLLDGAQRTVRVIRRNIWISLFYNLIGSGLAIAGLLHPLVAAILMPLSSLSVVSMSYRSRTFVPSGGS
jgi:Cu2+-exporting ATPase